MKAHNRILFVDDERHVLDSLRRLLYRRCADWQMTFMENPARAWDHLLDEEFDVAVLDVRMPLIDGLELLQRMQSHPSTKDVPVIILTGEGERSLKRRALELGATDLLSKPIDPDELKARLASALKLKNYHDQLKLQNETLAKKVRERTAELSRSRLDIVWRLAKAAEYRDEETGNHVVRVSSYSRIIGHGLGMDSDFVENVCVTAPLHDIGKIGIPDAILLKRGRLDEQEWAVMQQHCAIGAKILSEESKAMTIYFKLRGDTDEQMTALKPDPTLQMALDIVRCHHEWWDGTGYPSGLAGEAIPLAGRIVAISDVFDALTSERPYKSAIDLEESRKIIESSSGNHFDPQVVDVFLSNFKEMCDIRRELADITDSGTRQSLLFTGDI